MNIIKKISMAVLAVAILVSTAACHPKDEIAVTIGDIDFTSAYYMCALINADSEAKSIVDEAKADEDNAEIDYYSEKVEDKKFVTWVEDTAMDNLREIAAYKTLCKENKLEISEDDKANAEYYASFYWSSYGYGAYFEPNGVSEATYTQYMTDTYYANVYFEHLYGEKGEKAIDAETVKTEMYKNFIIADMLTADFSGKEDADKTALKDKFNTYLTDLQNKKKSFEEIYKDYNGETEETETEETDEPQPKDKYASILGAEDTAYESDQFDTVNAMKTGEIKLIELENDAGLILAVKGDITADPYYLENLDMTTRHLLKDEEFEKDIKAYADKMTVKTNDYAVKQFKVKNIKEPEVAY